MTQLTIDADAILKRATPAGAPAGPGDSAIWAPIVSDVIRRNELQVWFVAERVVEMPLTHLV